MPRGQTLQISGKNLGAFALPDACPRCSWLKLRQKELPYQIFPGIFSSIDSFTKNAVHGWFDRHGAPPPSLARMGPYVGYQNPPGARKFFLHDATLDVKLTGAPDAVLERADGTLAIADYKTARFTEHQDELAPMYETQLNAYALIAHGLGWAPVTELLLVYMEPHAESAGHDGHQDEDGLRMGFRANARRVGLDVARVPALMQKARELWDADEAPAGREGCKNCQAVAEMTMRLAGRVLTP